MARIKIGKITIPKGKSAYQSWLELGNTGTEADFINSLKAKKSSLILSASNIVKVLEVPLDRGINQCQGFTYNKTLDAFFIACISGDNERQVFYKYNNDFSSLVSKQTFNDKNRLGHCNTLCSVDDKIYITNGAVNPNQVVVMNGSMAIESTVNFPNKVFNLGYDSSAQKFVSILYTGTKNSRNLQFYSKDRVAGENKTINVLSDSVDTNGALFFEGKVLISVGNYIIENDKDDVISHGINNSLEIEDFAVKNGEVYFTANNNGKVEVYKHSNSVEYFNNINFIPPSSDLPALKNNVPLYGLDTSGNKWALIKMSAGNGTEVGHKDKPLAFSASRLTWWDGVTSRSVLTTKDFDTSSKVLYRKSECDDLFISKEKYESDLTALKTALDKLNQ